MNRATWTVVTAGLICVMWSAGAQAQQTYRCGKVFQDRPCDGNQQINSPPSSSSSTSSSGAQNAARQSGSADCARRGEEAQKIVWAKEAGRTEEMQLAATPAFEQKKLIADVYRRKGTSGEMRAAIEAECNAERERAAQAAALISAGRALQQENRPVAPAAAAAPSEAEQAAAKRGAVASTEAAKQSRCKYLSARLTSIRSEQRAGTSAGSMDRLNQEYADTERSRRDTGC